MFQSMKKIKKALGTFYFEFAAAIGRGGNEAWRLQDLTNLDELPDYHEGGYYSARNVGTPVNAEGVPSVLRSFSQLERRQK